MDLGKKNEVNTVDNINRLDDKFSPEHQQEDTNMNQEDLSELNNNNQVNQDNATPNAMKNNGFNNAGLVDQLSSENIQIRPDLNIKCPFSPENIQVTPHHEDLLNNVNEQNNQRDTSYPIQEQNQKILEPT